jgi:hypothetical protein
MEPSLRLEVLLEPDRYILPAAVGLNRAVKSSSDHGRALDFGLSFSTKNRKGVSRQTATRNVATNLGMQFKEEIPMKKLFLVLAVLAMSFAPAMAAAQNLHPAGDKPMIQTTVPAVISSVPALNGPPPGVMTQVPAVNGTVPNLMSPIPGVQGQIPALSGSIPNLTGSVPSLTSGIPSTSNAAGPIPSTIAPVPTAIGTVPSVKSDRGWSPLCVLKSYLNLTDTSCRQR